MSFFEGESSVQRAKGDVVEWERKGSPSSLLCPACGQTKSFKQVERSGAYLIIRCVECGLEFSDPMVAADGDWYDKAYVIHHAALDTRIHDYYRWAVRHLPRGSLLDVGCGGGVFVHYARSHGFSAEGIDFSGDAVSQGARWFGLSCLRTGTLQDLKKENKNYSSITFFEVLEHVPDPLAFLREVTSLLRPGGSIALSVPYRDRWPVRDINDFPPNHLTRWTPLALQKLFQRAGFRDFRVEFTSSFKSCQIFFEYLVRWVFYHFWGVRYTEDPSRVVSTRSSWLRKERVRAVLSTLRPRQVRRILLFPFVFISWPFVNRWFHGHNLMAMAVLPSEN